MLSQWRGCIPNDNNLRKKAIIILFPQARYTYFFHNYELKKPVLDVKMWIGICKLFDMPEKQQGKCHTLEKNHCLKSWKWEEAWGDGERWGGAMGRGRRALWPQSLKLQSRGVPIRLSWSLLSCCCGNRSHPKQNDHHYLEWLPPDLTSRGVHVVALLSVFFFFLRSHWCSIERFLTSLQLR